MLSWEWRLGAIGASKVRGLGQGFEIWTQRRQGGSIDWIQVGLENICAHSRSLLLLRARSLRFRESWAVCEELGLALSLWLGSTWIRTSELVTLRAYCTLKRCVLRPALSSNVTASS